MEEQRKMGNLYGRTRDITWESKGARLLGMWLVYALAAPLFFAATNILDSLFMRKYERSPVVYMFYAGLLMVPFVAFIPLFIGIGMKWIILITITTIVAYVGDVLYFHAVGRMDISVTNASWAILSIFVSIGGFLFFQERWSFLQSAGSVLVLGGILFLSYWHRHVSIPRTVLIFSGVAVFIAPVVLIGKAALTDGAGVVPVTFWAIIGRQIPYLIVPLLRRSWRRGVLDLAQRVHLEFYALVVLAILFWLTGLYMSMTAIGLSFVSLTVIVENAQPFFVLLFAWLVANLSSRFAPRELLTAQSVGVKLASFVIVFAGLALLAAG